MGLATQQMAKNSASTSRNENADAGVDKNVDGNRGKPVAFLKVTKWSQTSENIATLVEEIPTVYPIFKGSNVIGRSKASSICFPFSVVSARHAAIDVKETLHTVRDYVSTNETKRNEVALEPDVRYEIFDGTKLSFADIECTYYVGRLPDGIEGDDLKLDAAFEWKFKEQDSRRSSTGASTTALTIFKNFLSEDDDSRDMLDQEDGVQATDGQASRTSAPPASRKNDNAGPGLDVLVEESQFIGDERPSIESIFANASKNIQYVVRETEQFLIDENVPTIDSTGDGGIEKRRGIDSLDMHPPQPGEYEDENYVNQVVSAGETKDSRDESSINSAIRETKISTTSNRDDSSLEEAIRSNGAIPDEDMPAAAETLPYLGGLPVPLDSLKVDHRLNLVAMTPASSANGKTPQTAGTSKAGRNQTSVWSVPTSDNTSNRTKRKRSLMDEAVEDWLFRSEPDMRRKKGRTAAASRRHTTIDKPKNRLEELSVKCNQSIIAAKRVSKEKKAVEEETSDASIVQLASEVAAKVKDPFEFGPSQMTFSAGSTASGGSGAKFQSSKKVQKARKSVKTSSDSDATSTVTPFSSNAPSKQKRRNDETKCDEAKFDEAAEKSRQQRCKANTQKKKPHCTNLVQSPEGEESIESHSTIKEFLPADPKAEGSPDEIRNTNEENSSETGVTNGVSSEQRSRRTNSQADGRSHVKDEVLGEAPKPRKPRAAAKKKPVEMPKQLERPEKEPSEESPELIFPEKPQRKKAAASGGRAKAGKGDSKTTTKKAPKKGITVSQETSPPIRVCFTQLTDKEQLAKLEQAVKDMKGEVVDSGIECTHLVVPKFGRSVKFMCSVGRGIPIVTPQWVEKSKVAGHFLDTDKFIVSDKAEEKRLDFNMRECLDKAHQCIATENTRLFDGYVFYSTESVRPNRMDMKAIVTAAGGRFLESLPKSAPKNDKFVALSCEADAETADIKRLKTMQVPIVSMEFVLTGLLRREVNIGKYALLANEASTADEAPKGRKRAKVESSNSSRTSSVEPGKGKKTAKGKK